MLSINDISFGKYKGKTLTHLLRDRKYCSWLLEQEWFEDKHGYLYNKVISYDPSPYFFVTPPEDCVDFIQRYKYFNMTPIDSLEIELTEEEKNCYKFYLETIEIIKSRIIERMSKLELKPELNIYDIKAPSNWLKKFETTYGINREIFKEFLTAYDLVNIPYIIEDIKKEGNIEYKGAKSFIIAKKNSVEQEKYWEDILKKKHGELISPQFVYEKCIFDFINISSNTIYEVKLSLKDFDKKQYAKYLLVSRGRTPYDPALSPYKIIYLIGYDCIVNISESKIYTTDRAKYITHQLMTTFNKKKTDLDMIIQNFEIHEVGGSAPYDPHL